MVTSFANWIDASSGIVTIAVSNELGIRSSYYPLPDFARVIVLDILDEALISSVVKVLDPCSNLLFTVDITTTEVLLPIEQLPRSSAFIQFENKYTIQIN